MPSSARRTADRRSAADHLMLVRYKETRDPRARDAIVERYLPLARSIAQRFRGRHEAMDDLNQVAALALVKAVDRFDPDQGNAFSSFAVPTITGELKRHLRDRTWSVRPPRDLLEDALRVDRAVARLSAEHQRAPTVKEIADDLGTMDEEAVLEARYASRAHHASSLDAPTVGADDDTITLGDSIGVEERGFELAEKRTTLSKLMKAVPERDRSVLAMRFVEDRTQAEIGQELGVSQMQVSRILRRALERLETVATAEA